MKSTFYTYLFFLPILLPCAYGQPQRSGEPIDFMTIVIEGKENLYLPKSLIKHTPQLPPPYQQLELDSINPLEKVPLYRSEPIPNPDRIVEPSAQSAALRFSAGLYGFATLEGLYRTQLGAYVIDFNGILDRGGPYLANADYFRTNFRLRGQAAWQQAPHAHFTTSTGIANVETRSYRLFALPSAPERMTRSLLLSLEHNGMLAASPYQVSMIAGTVRLQHADTNTTEETELAAHARIEPYRFNTITLGLLADVSYRNYRTTPIHFHTLAATGRYTDSTFTLSAHLGGQIATTSFRTTTFAPLLELRSELAITSFLCLDGRIASRMEPVRFRDLLALCPYIVDTAAIAVQMATYHVAAGVTYLPRPEIQFRLEAGIQGFSEAPFFESVADGTFALLYTEQTERFVHLRGRYDIDRSNHLIADLRLLDARFTDGKTVPYRPLLQTIVEYGHSMDEQFLASLRIGYVSPRHVSQQSEQTLRAYVVIAARAEYQISPSISVTATLDNLAGSIIELWRGYRERGSFVAIGAVVHF
ncbi:MAG: hypothetical protein N2971_02375 [Chlorobi bacterium]|nr:hypothetical protein [Chlorobiota bacterium]